MMEVILDINNPGTCAVCKKKTDDPFAYVHYECALIYDEQRKKDRKEKRSEDVRNKRKRRID